MTIKNFNELLKEDFSIAGGKGASLGEMLQAGIKVPPVFVILSETFNNFLNETSLYTGIKSILDTVNHDGMHTVEHSSEKIQSLITNTSIPKELGENIFKEFEKLDSEYVAVRSSATAEDSASAAWAGQLNSYLNTTKDNLIENVKNCWASLFTPRAIFYRFEQGLQKSHISVAVIVQKRVESEVSGIAFSVHPVTENEDQLIIEVGLGFGEAIVSGQITPDSYVVDKRDWRILEKSMHSQEKKLVRDGNKNIWIPLTE